MDVRQILGLEKVDQTTGCFVTAVKKPCICILRNGKEHHVLAQWLSPDKSALGGPVGQVRHICLYEPTVGARLVLLVDTPEAITKQLQVPGREKTVHFMSACFVQVEAMVGVNTDDISVLEVPLVPF